MSRAEKAARAAELRAQGLIAREIAERMGVSPSYAFELLDDPDGSKVKARKARYRGTCIDCGAPTDGSNGRARAPKRCASCDLAHRTTDRLWTREAVVELIREWAEVYGAPPGAMDWEPCMARDKGRDDIAERFERDGCWPHVSTVQRLFGSWSAAIAAAGFTPRKPGQRGPGTPPVRALVA